MDEKTRTFDLLRRKLSWSISYSEYQSNKKEANTAIKNPEYEK